MFIYVYILRDKHNVLGKNREITNEGGKTYLPPHR